jgi:hypothetical protein
MTKKHWDIFSKKTLQNLNIIRINLNFTPKSRECQKLHALYKLAAKYALTTVK